MTAKAARSCLAAAILFFPSSALALTSALEKEGAETLIFSAQRTPQKVSKIPQSVAVLPAKKLRALPASNPAEALAGTPGIDIDGRTKTGHFTPISIRGSASRHVLVMVDGIPFNTQASGQADILPALSLQNLDRIEVLKGPASNAWGSGMGGAVNLITKETGSSSRPDSAIATAWGEFRSQRHWLQTRGSAEGTGYYFSGEYDEFGGTRENSPRSNRDDTLQKKFFAKASRFFGLVKAVASYGYTGNNVSEGFYRTANQRIEVPYYARYGALRLESGEVEADYLEAAIKFNDQRILTDTYGASENLLSSVKHHDAYYGTEFKGVLRPRDEDTLVMGYDVARQGLKSSQMDMAREVWVHAPYVNYTLGLSPVDLAGGMRYDFNSEFGDQWNPSAGAIYRCPWGEETFLRLNAARAFHAPALLWKYFEDTVPGLTGNNPAIRPERAWVYEASAETWLLPPLFAKFSLYRSDVSDALATRQSPSGLFIKENIQKFRQESVELETRWTLAKAAELSFAGGYNGVEDRTTGLDVRGRGVARSYFRLELDVERDGWLLALAGRYNRWDSNASSIPNDRKFLWDSRLARAFTVADGLQAELFLNIYNLTNSKYWADINFPTPPRYFEGGINLEF